MTRLKIAALALGLFVFLPALPSVAGAQESGVLRGRVLDATTMDPIGWAFVGPASSNRGVLTDSLGYFALPVDQPTPFALRVAQLGYQNLETRVEAFGPQTLLTINLVPEPLEIEGLTVLTDRLAERRRGVFGIVEVLDRGQLLSDSGGSAFDLVFRMLPFVAPCGVGSEALCLSGRSAMGQQREIKICLDDRQIPSAMMETALAGIDPRSLYLVEVYGRVGEVRLYSPGYIKRVLENGASLRPLTFGCGTGPR